MTAATAGDTADEGGTHTPRRRYSDLATTAHLRRGCQSLCFLVLHSFGMLLMLGQSFPSMGELVYQEIDTS